MARSLLAPGREQWSERTMGDDAMDAERRHARLDREAKAGNARRGITALASSAPPPSLAVLDALQAAERHVIEAAVSLRVVLDLGPLVAPSAVMSAEARFHSARSWLERSGVPGSDPAGLREVSRRVGSARLRLIRVVYPEPLSVKLRIPCPLCERMSLRVHVAAMREDSYVRCQATRCGGSWPWSTWGHFGDLTGVDVWTALQDAEAA